MKYTRSKVRKALPETYGYILEELIYQYDETTTKNGYYQQIIEKIILLGEAKRFRNRISLSNPTSDYRSPTCYWGYL